MKLKKCFSRNRKIDKVSHVLFNLAMKELEYLSSENNTMQGNQSSWFPVKFRRRAPTGRGSIQGGAGVRVLRHWKVCDEHLVRGKPGQGGKPGTYSVLLNIF